jgi:RNA polymerase sigma factor (sigma-70 family)
MQNKELIPHLFRTEYTKIIAVLVKLFGFEHIEIAEDIVSDTFLVASEAWGQKGVPQNPTAWLYTVAKNKAKDFFRHHAVFTQKVSVEIKHSPAFYQEIELDLSHKNIEDSQLQMMFAICHPAISVEAQIGLSLSILCGFGVEEIADAFLSTKEKIYKRLSRAKNKLRAAQVKIELPTQAAINERLDTVLTTLYLLFSEGYYSLSKNTTLRKDLCLEAMRLNYLLIENALTNTPKANALLSLMCFHASRFEARTGLNGELILYDEQDTSLWNTELIARGEYYLNQASTGNKLTKYHLEAAIAYWHTIREDTHHKWENILQLYNQLLQIQYSPIAALNRTYALSRADGKAAAIIEAEKLRLEDNHLYHSLLGDLYSGIDNEKALLHLERALKLSKSVTEREVIAAKIFHEKEKSHS